MRRSQQVLLEHGFEDKNPFSISDLYAHALKESYQMPSTSALAPVFWFIFIIALIPITLLLLKRTTLLRSISSAPQVLRHIAALSISPNQRLVVVEVGGSQERQWLVLGVTAQNITLLHTMDPQEDVSISPSTPITPLSLPQWLNQLRSRKKS